MPKSPRSIPDSPLSREADRAVAEARKLREEGKIEVAANLVAGVVRSMPGHLPALRLMASLAMQTGTPAIAIGCLIQAQRLAPRALDIFIDLGRAYLADKNPEGALHTFRQTIDLHPRDGAAFRGLGEAQLDLGQTENALKSFRKALSLLPYDSYAKHMVAALSGTPQADAGGYVSALFDAYAPIFDEHLTTTLDYHIPQQLMDLVQAAGGGPFLRLLDLGCGTGLVGTAFQSLVKAMDGIDISPNMIAKAREREIYDTLATGDMLELLTRGQAFSGPYDLVIAADVFIYVGPLDAAFPAVRKVLTPNGYFAFSIELADTPTCAIRSSGRYAHSDAYVRTEAEKAGFTIAECRQSAIRQERGDPVPGANYLLTPN